MNDEIIELQTKLAFQDSLLEQLNEVVTDQQQQIDHLQQALQTLKTQVTSIQSSMHDLDQQQQQPPPHY